VEVQNPFLARGGVSNYTYKQYERV